MLPDNYPRIDIYWEEDPDRQKEYKEAFSRLLSIQIESFGDNTVGVVVVEDMRRVIPIVLDDGYYLSEIGGILAAAALVSDIFFPVIFLEEDYYIEMARNPVRRSNIFHEVGHIVLKHLKKSDRDKMDNTMARQRAKDSGELFWQEAEADLFACHYVGKENMLRHLKALRQDIFNMTRKGRFPAEAGAEHLKETDLRIENIVRQG